MMVVAPGCWRRARTRAESGTFLYGWTPGSGIFAGVGTACLLGTPRKTRMGIGTRQPETSHVQPIPRPERHARSFSETGFFYAHRETPCHEHAGDAAYRSETTGIIAVIAKSESRRCTRRGISIPWGKRASSGMTVAASGSTWGRLREKTTTPKKRIRIQGVEDALDPTNAPGRTCQAGDFSAVIPPHHEEHQNGCWLLPSRVTPGFQADSVNRREAAGRLRPSPATRG